MGRFYSEHNDVFFGFDLCIIDNHHSGLFRLRSICCPETNEIVPADQQGCGSCHGRCIKIVFDPPDVLFHECLFAPGYLINVDAAERVMTSMEIPGRLLELENNDVGGNKSFMRRWMTSTGWRTWDTTLM